MLLHRDLDLYLQGRVIENAIICLTVTFVSFDILHLMRQELICTPDLDIKFQGHIPQTLIYPKL